MALRFDRFVSRAVTRVGDEPRSGTNLEAFFDLIYVVAVARSVAVFHSLLAEGHSTRALAMFAATFFAVWWSWVGYTWFANAHDGDTVTDRFLTFIQMIGALIIAAGIPQAAQNEEFRVVVLGYFVARVGLVAAWLRVARDDPASRDRALRYAAGLVVLQTFWVARIWFPHGTLTASFVLLVIAELAVPYWASRSASTLPLHAQHIEERYGLFTIILLGESVASAVIGFQTAYDHGGFSGSLVLLALCGLVLAFACWWLYFDHPGHLAPTEKTAYRWGYGHVVLFASLATLGGGLADAFEKLSEDSQASTRAASLAVALPVSGFLLGLVLLMLVNGVRGDDIRIVPKVVGALIVAGGGLVLSSMATTILSAVVLLVLVLWMILDAPDPVDVSTTASSV